MWVWPSLQLLRTGKSPFWLPSFLLTSEMLKTTNSWGILLILDHSTSHGLSQQLLGVSCSETYGSLTDESLGERNVFLSLVVIPFSFCFLKVFPAPTPPVMSHALSLQCRQSILLASCRNVISLQPNAPGLSSFPSSQNISSAIHSLLWDYISDNLTLITTCLSELEH